MASYSGTFTVADMTDIGGEQRVIAIDHGLNTMNPIVAVYSNVNGRCLDIGSGNISQVALHDINQTPSPNVIVLTMYIDALLPSTDSFAVRVIT